MAAQLFSGNVPSYPSLNPESKIILFVDDEPYILEAVKRNLFGKFDIQTALSGLEALALLRNQNEFAVVVSDYLMPGMDGIAFLKQVAEISPHTVRILLTGQAHLEMSIRAVNEGNIFRLLLKPCAPDFLEKALNDALRQRQLLQAEREYYALQRWNQSLGGLVKAFIRLMESKDPYTAGHQQRVSVFASAIARAMNLPQDTADQIRVAAMIHDIGKIYVPVEFLNRPGKLNSSEWDIVKMHAQIGHDILKPVGFPFPIHEIIYQHHERIDGSGYPRGLKGSEICIEAAILAIADVVEAIAHHRPYRPAKGIDEAIQELRELGGIKYDRRAAEAALELLTKHQFQFD